MAHPRIARGDITPVPQHHTERVFARTDGFCNIEHVVKHRLVVIGRRLCQHLRADTLPVDIRFVKPQSRDVQHRPAHFARCVEFLSEITRRQAGMPLRALPSETPVEADPPGFPGRSIHKSHRPRRRLRPGRAPFAGLYPNLPEAGLPASERRPAVRDIYRLVRPHPARIPFIPPVCVQVLFGRGHQNAVKSLFHAPLAGNEFPTQVRSGSRKPYGIHLHFAPRIHYPNDITAAGHPEEGHEAGR